MMVYAITLTAEDHGYTIDVDKRWCEFGDKKEILDRSETKRCLMIENDYHIAIGTFNSLNSFISFLVDEKIIEKNVFRYKKSWIRIRDEKRDKIQKEKDRSDNDRMDKEVN